MKLHVRKGDTVVVIAGKDKGKTGKFLLLFQVIMLLWSRELISFLVTRNLEMHKTKVAL